MPRTKNSMQSQYKYNKEHLKRVPLDMQLEEYNQLKQFVTDRGYTVNGFIKQAIREKLKREVNQTE